MNEYIAIVNEGCCVDYGFIFAVKAENKKSAKDKVYKRCKENGYVKEGIKIYEMKDFFNDDLFCVNGDVTEII